jgi:hypothetical protein
MSLLYTPSVDPSSAEQVAALRSLSREDVAAVFARAVAPGGAVRRPLTSLVHARGQRGTGAAPAGTEWVADERAFHATLPVVKRPRGSVPPLARRAQGARA